MLPPPARETTTAPRIIAALLFVLVFPSIGVSQLFVWMDGPNGSADQIVMALSLAIVSPLFGVVTGWPYILAACGAWATLSRFERHYQWAAAVIGLAVGLMAGLRLTGAVWDDSGPIIPLIAGIGMLTGLGAWRIAYARRDRPRHRDRSRNQAGS
jgi:hypothetical protein